MLLKVYLSLFHLNLFLVHLLLQHLDFPLILNLHLLFLFFKNSSFFLELLVLLMLEPLVVLLQFHLLLLEFGQYSLIVPLDFSYFFLVPDFHLFLNFLIMFLKFQHFFFGSILNKLLLKLIADDIKYPFELFVSVGWILENPNLGTKVQQIESGLNCGGNFFRNFGHLKGLHNFVNILFVIHLLRCQGRNSFEGKFESFHLVFEVLFVTNLPKLVVKVFIG